jgi:uncharacterized protein YbcV (DUF1398 family)
MFTIEQIKERHSRVRSGADFPAYIRDLAQFGVKKYDSFVGDGSTRYFGKDNYNVQSGPKYPVLAISETSDQKEFEHCLGIHQQGQTDYLTFCRQSAAAGIEKWTVDLEQMTCSYFDIAGNNLLTENIPDA